VIWKKGPAPPGREQRSSRGYDPAIGHTRKNIWLGATLLIRRNVGERARLVKLARPLISPDSADESDGRGWSVSHIRWCRRSPQPRRASAKGRSSARYRPP